MAADFYHNIFYTGTISQSGRMSIFVLSSESSDSQRRFICRLSWYFRYVRQTLQR